MNFYNILNLFSNILKVFHLMDFHAKRSIIER